MGLKAWIAKKALTGKLPLWLYRVIGQRIAKMLKWEGKMADENVKSKWMSKTVWAAVLTAILGGIQPISAAFGHPIAVPLWIIEVLSGLGLYSLRTATTKVE